MNVDDIARRAGQEIRDSVQTDAGTAYLEFQDRAARRRRVHAVGVASAVAVVLLIAFGAAQWLGASPRDTGTPVDRDDSRPPSHPAHGYGVGCNNERVTCLGHRTYEVFFDVDMTWTLPRGFDAPYSGLGPTNSSVESFLKGPDGDVTGGVSVYHHVSAATLAPIPRARSDVRTAKEFAEWVSTRPFLEAGSVHSIRVGDRTAWTVDVAVPPGTPEGLNRCVDRRVGCYPVIYWTTGSDHAMAGIWEGVTARYTAFDLHGSGITVVWSWSFTGTIPASLDAVVSSIRFG